MQETENPTGQAPEGSQGQAPEAESAEKLDTFSRDYVENLRKESAAYRAKLRDLEARVKADENSKLSEVEKLRNQLTEAEIKAKEYAGQMRAAAIKAEIAISANKRKIADPEVAFRLLDQSAIEFDDSGRPANLDAAIEDLTKRFPILISNNAPNPTPTNNPARVNDPAATLTREQVERMTPAEINENWDAVRRALSK